MTTIAGMELNEAAAEAAGNWRRFEAFAWHRRYDLADAENWTIIYTNHRDSGLLDQSNADAIGKALAPFTDGDDPDVIAESHSHWAVGWIDGFAVRAFKEGQITEAFRTYHELAERMANYPVLDEEDYSRREYDATLANITDAARSLRHDYDLPDGWESEVFSWFWSNNQRAVENRDDQGGYPSEDDLEEAFEALGYPRAE